MFGHSELECRKQKLHIQQDKPVPNDVQTIVVEATDPIEKVIVVTQEISACPANGGNNTAHKQISQTATSSAWVTHLKTAKPPDKLQPKKTQIMNKNIFQALHNDTRNMDANLPLNVGGKLIPSTGKVELL